MNEYLICVLVLIPTIACWDFGRRWLKRQDYLASLEVLSRKVEDLDRTLHQELESHKLRHDKAIGNLASQTQESLHVLEKKQNTILSGNMMGPSQRGARGIIR